jgi:hypothetical protein
LKDNGKLELKDIEFSKSRFRNYFGNIGEMVTEEILLREGFAVCRWRPYVAGDVLPKSDVSKNLRRCLNCLYPSGRDAYDDRIIEELEDFFGNRLSDFKKYTDSLGIFDQVSNATYTPDLVAKKDNKIFIIEVKTNSGNIYLKREKDKLRGLLSARKFNLIPMLVNLNIGIQATDFIMKEL